MQRFGLGSWARSVLSLTLSLSLMIPTNFAHAREITEEQFGQVAQHLTTEEQEALTRISHEVSTLSKAFADPSGPAHALDEFDLLQQDVIDQRKEAIKTKIEHIKTEDFKIRRQEEVQFLLSQAAKNPRRTIEFIGADQVRIAADMLGLSPERDLSAIIETAATNDQIAELFDIRPEELEHFVDEEISPRRLYRMNLKIKVSKFEENPLSAEPENLSHETRVALLDQRDAEGSASHSFSSQDFFKAFDDGDYRFEILTSKGELIHTFNRPVAAVGFYGRFLVYVDRENTGLLRFIDLDYFKGAIGNTNLPAFNLPIEKGEIQDIRISKGSLVVNEKNIPYEAFNFVSDLYRVFFNLKVSLMDPKTVDSTIHLVKELSYFKDQAMANMDQLETEMINSALGGSEKISEFVAKMETNLETQAKVGPIKPATEIPEKLQKNLADQPELLMTFTPSIQVIQNEVLNQDRLIKANRSIMVSRQFVSRMNLLMAKLVHPQPMGSPKIIQGMAMLAESVLKRDWKAASLDWQDLKKNPIVAYGRFGAPVLAAAAIGSTISDSFALSIYDGLQMGGHLIRDYLQHTDYGLNFARLMGTAGSTALSGFPGVTNYFTAENLPRLATLGAAMSGLILAIYGSLHLTANTIGTIRYFSRHKEWIGKARAEGASFIGSYTAAFIKYQNALRLYYNKGRAQAEAASSKTSTSLNEAQNQVAEEVYRETTARKKSIFQRISSAFKNSRNEINKLTGKLVETGESAEKIDDGKIRTLGQAIGQFALSYPSGLITSRFAGRIWNYWFMIRTFALSPQTWPMFLTYPELFRIGIDGGKDKLHMPSQFNGGYRSRLATWKFQYNHRKDDTSLATLKRFEKSMLPIEAMAYEVALEKSLELLIQEVKDPEQLKEFFDSANLPRRPLPPSAIMGGASSSSGIRTLSDPKLRRLSKQHRTFFRSVFNQLYEKTTETFVVRFLNSVNPEASLSSISEIREAGMEAAPDLEELVNSLKGPKARQVRQEITTITSQIASSGGIVEEARQVSKAMDRMGERLMLNAEHSTVAKLDPHGAQVARFKTAERQLKNVKAVVRAMNAVVSEIAIEKVVGLLTILVMYSAVTDSMLSPLQEEMFGPDSWFYGSRYLFLNSFASGVVIAALANVWMKVQLDDRIDSQGGFNKITTTEDRDKSYFRYYLKSFFKNPANKWSNNQINQMRLIWANMSAALVTIAVTNFLTLGRFDLGAFMTGYMVIFLTPLSGIDLKLDQTHELASRWQSSQIMRKLRTHPKIQGWIDKSVMAKRLPHSIGTSAYGFFMGPFVSLYELMDTPEFGKRSFLNLLFFGYQPEEIISQGLQKVNKYLGFIPGVEYVTQTCESLLTNNNTALDPSKLMKPPVGPK